MRAIAHKLELNVTFRAGPAGLRGQRGAPAAARPRSAAEDVAQTRGAADSIALRLRYHDSKLHARETPKNEAAREVFEAIELARVEAIGALQMKGVAANLDRVPRRALPPARLRPSDRARARPAGRGAAPAGPRGHDRRRRRRPAPSAWSSSGARRSAMPRGPISPSSPR